jgi:hypothetical protein
MAPEAEPINLFFETTFHTATGLVYPEYCACVRIALSCCALWCCCCERARARVCMLCEWWWWWWWWWW